MRNRLHVFQKMPVLLEYNFPLISIPKFHIMIVLFELFHPKRRFNGLLVTAAGL